MLASQMGPEILKQMLKNVSEGPGVFTGASWPQKVVYGRVSILQNCTKMHQQLVSERPEMSRLLILLVSAKQGLGRRADS